MGVCPAAVTKTHHTNDGEYAGRICWAVTGTFCGGKVQGSYAEKQESCNQCAFFARVKEEEKGQFKILPPEDVGSCYTQETADRVEVGLRMIERFTHASAYAFEKAFVEIMQAKKNRGNKKLRFILDFRKTTYIDSAGMGMILMLRQQCGGSDADVRLVNVRPAVKSILDQANLGTLFLINQKA
ncbi:MAG: STAS domain-containing protein [Magnetococcales bacterium]|nr:STAS domain-containing protein [Magnetococcales bacterium]